MERRCRLLPLPLLLLTALSSPAAALALPRQNLLGGGGSGQRDLTIAGWSYCEGSPCPADCSQKPDPARQCLRCLCGPKLNFGDVVVPLYGSCPAGLRAAHPQQMLKICRANDCTPGATWKVNGGCSTCVCTREGEPACTTCLREATAATVTCKGRRPQCPANCGRTFNAELDCYDCVCSVGEEGDTVVGNHEQCPPGTDVRATGAFQKACAPEEELPRGDYVTCESTSCPDHCATVRVSTKRGCAFCQCGPLLEAGDEAVPLHQECRAPSFTGPLFPDSKVCKAPTRLRCRPGTTYNLECDICICQDDGLAACTRRNCTLPEYGDTQVCDAVYRACPADCEETGADSYCHYCQCGPRLKAGEVVVAADADCPAGLTVSAHQRATKTCSPAAGCVHGPAFIDECTNVCRCIGDGYACDRKACQSGQRSAEPLTCDQRTRLPRLGTVRVYCHQGIIKIQRRDEPCVPNSWSMDSENCNKCNCLTNGLLVCTRKACFKRPTGRY